MEEFSKKLCGRLPDGIDFAMFSGSFAVKDGVTYRETAYWKDVALFAWEDTAKETELARVERESLEERFMMFAECSYQGVRYKILKIENADAYFSPFTNLEKIYCKPLAQMDEVWLQKNYGEAKIKVETLYQNPRITALPSADRFYPEEMYNGNFMVSYLEDFLDFKGTRELLVQLYGSRVRIGKPDPAGLAVDEYVVGMRIDGEEFDFTGDLAYGLLTISPRAVGGKPYIFEICDFFNRNKSSGS